MRWVVIQPTFMNRYQVMLRGENFLLDFMDEKEKCGFFTTVWVEAENPEEAELNAVAELKKHEDLISGILNESDDVPMIYLEEMRELEPDSKLQKSGGRTIFSAFDDEGQHEAKQIELDALWN